MAPWGRRIPCWLLAAALAVAHVRVATAGAGDQAVIEAAPAPPGPGQTGEPPDAGNAPAVATIGPVALGLGLAFGLLWIRLRAAPRPPPKRRGSGVAGRRAPVRTGAPQGRPGPARDPVSIVRPTLSASAWACRNCGTNNLGGAACVVCNHPRHGG